MVFGIWGMWASRQHWREHLIYYALFISFAGVTALFYGHTSHRAYLDIYLIVFAAGTLEQLQNRFFPRSRGRSYIVATQPRRILRRNELLQTVAFSNDEANR